MKQQANDTPTRHNEAELRHAINANATHHLRPDETECQTLRFEHELKIVQSSGYSHRQVQLCALDLDIIPERYIRNQRSLSTQEQISLLNSHVSIIGLGGLGGTVTEILARIGIGHLTLVDGDCFDDSNLNRQLLSTLDSLGKPKAEVAASRVAQINPAVDTTVCKDFFVAENSEAILQETTIAVDCLDTIAARFVLEKACQTMNIPLVSAAIGGTSGQATVIMPGDTGLERIYGSPDRAPRRGVEARLGTLPFAATAMAAIECAEIVALAAGRQACLHSKLLVADFRDQQMQLLNLE